MANDENLESKAVLASIFKVNHRLEILVQKEDGTLEIYKSRIEETNSENLVVAMPMSKGVPISLRSGDTFSGRMPSGTLTYQFTSRYIDRQLAPLPVWIISWPYEVTKIQQRAFVRMDIMLPAFLTVKTNTKNNEQEKINAMTKDISGGGLQLILETPFTLGDKIQVMVSIPESGMVTAVAEVTRVQKPQSDRPLFWVSAKFIDIQEKDRSNIIKFIFKKQLELRRKEV